MKFVIVFTCKRSFGRNGGRKPNKKQNQLTTTTTTLTESNNTALLPKIGTNCWWLSIVFGFYLLWSILFMEICTEATYNKIGLVRAAQMSATNISDSFNWNKRSMRQLFTGDLFNLAKFAQYMPFLHFSWLRLPWNHCFVVILRLANRFSI